MSIEVTDCEFNIKDIVQKSDLNQTTKDKLTNSAIIVLPISFPNSVQRGNFASETPNILKYIRSTHPEIDVGLFENPGEEKIQILQAADIIFPTFFIDIAKEYTNQILIAIISSYLYDKLKGDPNRDKKRVKTQIIYEDSETKITKHVSYEGPVSGLKDIEKIVNSKKKTK